MARRANDFEVDPAVILIEEPTGSFDEWLRGLQHDPPLDLGVSAAELLDQVRAEEAE